MLRRVGLLSLVLLLSIASAWAVDVTGRWAVKIMTPDGEINGVAAFTQEGNDVTGWLGPSESDPIPITMVLNGNKLIIETHPQPGRNVAFAKCEVTVGEDKMTGTIDTDKGTIEFVRAAPAKSEP